MADRSFLSWPFFDDSHRTLADNLESWAKTNLLNAHHIDTDIETQELVRSMGAAGWLKYTGSHTGTLDVRTICLIRETLARHNGLADFAFAMQGLGTGAISLFGSKAQKRLGWTRPCQVKQYRRSH